MIKITYDSEYLIKSIVSLCVFKTDWKSSEGKMPKTFTDRWESQMWRDKKYHVTDHLHYSQVYPESIPRKFLFEHRNFLTQQYNSQPSKYIPPAERPPKLEDFKSARSLGHFEITILGKSTIFLFE